MILFMILVDLFFNNCKGLVCGLETQAGGTFDHGVRSDLGLILFVFLYLGLGPRWIREGLYRIVLGFLFLKESFGCFVKILITLFFAKS